MSPEAGCWARLTIGKKCFVQLHDGAHPDSTAETCPVMCTRNRVRSEVERALDARFSSTTTVFAGLISLEVEQRVW